MRGERGRERENAGWSIPGVVEDLGVIQSTLS